MLVSVCRGHISLVISIPWYLTLPPLYNKDSITPLPSYSERSTQIFVMRFETPHPPYMSFCVLVGTSSLVPHYVICYFVSRNIFFSCKCDLISPFTLALALALTLALALALALTLAQAIRNVHQHLHTDTVLMNINLSLVCVEMCPSTSSLST